MAAAEKLEAATAASGVAGGDGTGQRKEKSKKKKHKHKSSRRKQEREGYIGEVDARSVGNVAGEDAQRRPMSKSRSRSGRENDRSPFLMAPPSPNTGRARPRSPSPQSPAIMRNGGGYAKPDENLSDVMDNSGGGDGSKKAAEYDDFLNFLKKDAQQQRHQQHDHAPNQSDVSNQEQGERGEVDQTRLTGTVDRNDYSTAQTIDCIDHSAQAFRQQLNVSPGQDPPASPIPGIDEVVKPQQSSSFPRPPFPPPSKLRSKSPYDQNGARQRSKSPYDRNKARLRNKSPYNRNVLHPPPFTKQGGSFHDDADAPKRPDPEDTEEFNQANQSINTNNNTMAHQHHPQSQYQGQFQGPPSPSPSMAPPPREGYTIQQQQQSYPAPRAQQASMNAGANNLLSDLLPYDDSTKNTEPGQKYLEQDEVSLMSVQSSVTRNMEKLKEQKKAQKDRRNMDGISSRLDELDSISRDESGSMERKTRGGSASSHVSSFDLINTSDFDERGYCKHHPTVRLRKKQFMRGWKTVLSNCPECCLDEMRRIQESRKKNHKESSSRRRGGDDDISRSGESRHSRSSKESKRRSGKKKKKKKSRSDRDDPNKPPPISQFSLSTAGSTNSSKSSQEFDDNRSIGTASTITISSYTHSTGGTRWQNYANDGQSVVSGGSGGTDDNSSVGSSGRKKDGNASSAACVTRMPYTDNHGENGWYTGQVDSSTGTPHGTGVMNYGNGAVYEGEWRDGVSATPSKTREEPGGLGSGSMPRPSSLRYRAPPLSGPFGRTPSFVGGGSYLATLNEDGSVSDNEFGASSFRNRSRSMSVPRQGGRGVASRMQMVPPPQQDDAQQQQRSVVCGMHWVDFNGSPGSYTGEVNASNLPDGMGSMRYDNPAGFVTEGVWRNGQIKGGGGDDDDNEDDDADYNDGDNNHYEEPITLP